MSTQRQPDAVDSPLDEETVAEYLLDNPAFFESRPEVLARLQLPHPAGGAVSLVERQMAILRQQNRQLERKLVDLLEVARGNDRLVERMQQLTIALFEADDIDGVVQAVFEQLRDAFGADQCTMITFAADTPAPARVVAREHADLAPFKGFLAAHRPVLGKLKPEQLAYLFGDAAGTIASAVLVPLGERAEHGFLGIGSHKAEQFNPTMGTVFLGRMGALIGLALARHRR